MRVPIEPPDQSRFFASLSLRSQFHHTFDHLSGVALFAKDNHVHIIASCRNFYSRFGFSNESEVIGRLDRELVPAYVVEHIVADDLKVMDQTPMEYRRKK